MLCLLLVPCVVSDKMGTGETPTSTPKKPASVGAVEKKKQASIVNYLPGAGGVRRGVTRLTSSSSQEVPLSPAVKSHGSDEECPQSGSMLTQTSMLSSTLLEMNADEEEDLVEQFCCTQTEEGECNSEGEVAEGMVGDRRERVISVRECEREREMVGNVRSPSSVRETLERAESSDESEEESKVVNDY